MGPEAGERDDGQHGAELRAGLRQPAGGGRARRRRRRLPAGDLEFGRIVASEKEAPNMIVDLV